MWTQRYCINPATNQWCCTSSCFEGYNSTLPMTLSMISTVGIHLAQSSEIPRREQKLVVCPTAMTAGEMKAMQLLFSLLAALPAETNAFSLPCYVFTKVVLRDICRCCLWVGATVLDLCACKSKAYIGCSSKGALREFGFGTKGNERKGKAMC